MAAILCQSSAGSLLRQHALKQWRVCACMCASARVEVSLLVSTIKESARMHLCTKCTQAGCMCVSALAYIFCTASGVHLLACAHPRAHVCAEAAARAIDKCNGMTVLRRQFAVTACLSAWLDGRCT